MQAEDVRKYVGKRVLIVLKNHFKYTAEIPFFLGSTFTIKDKYGNEVTLDCDFILLISDFKEVLK